MAWQDAIDVVAKLKVKVMEHNNVDASLYHFCKEREENDERMEVDAIYDDLLAKTEGLQRAVISTSIILNTKTMIVEKKNLTNVK